MVAVTPKEGAAMVPVGDWTDEDVDTNDSTLYVDLETSIHLINDPEVNPELNNIPQHSK